MKNQAQKLLGGEIEKTRQLLVLGTVLFVVGLMFSGTITDVRAAGTDTTNVSLNVDAGTLDLSQAPSNFNFGNGAPDSNVTGNSGTDTGNAIITSDSRGSEPGWTLKGYFNADWNDGAGTTMAIASKMYWYANSITVNNNTGTDGDVQTGVNNTFAGTGSDNSLTMAIAAADNGGGVFDIYNLKMEYAIPVDATPASYTVDMVLTIT